MDAEPKEIVPEGRGGETREGFGAGYRKEESQSSPGISGKNKQPQPPFEAQKIEELKSLLTREAHQKPKWANEEVGLDSINIYNLPIGWKALAKLGRVINGMKDDPFDSSDLSDIKPPPNVYSALPMVASVIANRRNSDIPVVLPTQAEVKAMKPWLATIERFIGRFSQNWARKFEGYVEKKGQQVVLDIGSRISNVAEQVEGIKSPRQQFIKELTNLYNYLAKPQYEEVLGFSGYHNKEVEIEEKIWVLLSALRYIRGGGNHLFYTRDKYPLLTTILPIIKFPPDSLPDDQVTLAGAEIMEAINIFLRQQGVTRLMAVPKAREVNLLDVASWMRGIAETFFSGKLEKVKGDLPNVLTQVHDILPANGPQLSGKIYTIAKNICVLRAQGQTPEEIARHVFMR